MAPYVREIELTTLKTGAATQLRVKTYSPRDRARIRALERELRPWLESRGWLKPKE